MTDLPDVSNIPHAFENHSQYERLRTTGPKVVNGNENVSSLPHNIALTLMYAEWLADETYLSHRQAQVWALEQYAGESRQSIATILGVTPPTVDEHLTEAEQKTELATRFATILEFIKTRYFDYPRDSPPTLPILLAEQSWTYEDTEGLTQDSVGVVRHLVTVRWYADMRNQGEYHIETVDRMKDDRSVRHEVNSQRFQTLNEAIDSFYRDIETDSLYEAVVRWTVVKTVCNERQNSEQTIKLPSPTTLMTGDVEVGKLLDFVDEGLITVSEAEMFVDKGVESSIPQVEVTHQE